MDEKVVARLMKNLDRSGGEDSCWNWMGALNANTQSPQHAYGVINVGGKAVRVHRLMWELDNGPIPKGKHICHRCDNARCANPKHLFLGNPRDNMADMRIKGRHAYGEGHGHAKLFERDIPVIRMMAANGWGPVEMAKHYRVSEATIRDIIDGVTWTHVP